MDGSLAATKARRGVQSVEIGYRVLRAIQDAQTALPLTEIARRLGMTSSAVHNYLVSLQRTGLVQSDSRGSYRIGPSAFALGLVALRQIDGFDIVRDGAEALRDQTGLAMTITVWRDEGPVVVYKQDGLSHGALDIRPGMLLTPLGSAAGRAFVACLAPAVTADVLARHAGANPAAQQQDVAALRGEFARRCYAQQDLFGHISGYRAFAAPVFDETSCPRYVVTLMGPKADFSGRNGERFAAALVSATRQIGKSIGAPDLGSVT